MYVTQSRHEVFRGKNNLISIYKLKNQYAHSNQGFDLILVLKRHNLMNY
jgi:hypothetical protein